MRKEVREAARKEAQKEVRKGARKAKARKVRRLPRSIGDTQMENGSSMEYAVIAAKSATSGKSAGEG